MRVQMQSGVKSLARLCDGLGYIELTLILASLDSMSNPTVYVMRRSLHQERI